MVSMVSLKPWLSRGFEPEHELNKTTTNMPNELKDAMKRQERGDGWSPFLAFGVYEMSIMKPIPMTEKQESGKRSRSGFPARPILASPLVPVWRNHEITKHEWNVQYFSKEKSLFEFLIILPSWVFHVFLFSVFLRHFLKNRGFDGTSL